MKIVDNISYEISYKSHMWLKFVFAGCVSLEGRAGADVAFNTYSYGKWAEKCLWRPLILFCLHKI